MNILYENSQIILYAYIFVSFFLIRKPYLSLGFFLFFRITFAVFAYIDAHGIGGVSYFFIPLFMISLFGILYSVTSYVKLHVNTTSFAALLFVFFIIALSMISIKDGVSITLVARELLKIILPFSAYLIVYYGINNIQDVDKFASCIIITSIIPIIVGFIEVVLGVGYSFTMLTFVPKIRPAGTIIDPNLFGIYLSLILSLVVTQVRCGKKYVLMIIMLVIMIVLAKNRGTWIALTISILFANIIYKKNVSFVKFSILFLLIITFAAPIFVDRFNDLHQEDQWGQSQNTALHRFQYAQELMKKIYENPVLGSGIGSYELGYKGAGGAVLPHNDYIRIATQFGIFTMIIYFIFLITQLRRLIKFKNQNNWQYLYGGLIAQVYVLIISLVQNVLADTISFMIFMAIIAITHRSIEIEMAKNEK